MFIWIPRVYESSEVVFLQVSKPKLCTLYYKKQLLCGTQRGKYMFPPVIQKGRFWKTHKIKLFSTFSLEGHFFLGEPSVVLTWNNGLQKHLP